MTTFQAIIYALIHGISAFLPVSVSAHEVFIPYGFDWQAPSPALIVAMTWGTFLALFLYFRHEWASMISCLLQVILFRKKPMTLDERLPLFVGITFIPGFILTPYLQRVMPESLSHPLIVSAIFAAVAIPLWALDWVSRKTKGIFDWNWLDALLVGIFQACAQFPGFDPFVGLLLGGLFLNYRREAATKYAYFCLTPLLFGRSLALIKDVSFHSAMPDTELTWLSFSMAFLVTFLMGLLTIGGFMKHVQTKGFSQYAIYRWVVAGAVAVLFWVRNYG